jgi:RNA polymerase sigma factor (sigma-70 family)
MSPPDSFQDLIERVRAGDQQAAAELVRRYEPAIRRVVRFRLADSRLTRLLGSMDICQSVMASFFIRTAAGHYDISEPEQLVKLLGAMARNKLALQVRGHQRQRRDYRRVESGGLDKDVHAGGDPTPSQYLAGQELLLQVQQLMSPEERELVELRKDGLDWAAIAERQGGTAEGLRKQLARAVERVARQLGLDDYSDE